MKFLSKEKLVPFICKRSLQPLMHKLYLFSLTGMNYGNANTLGQELTGEKKLLQYVRNFTGKQTQFVLFDVGANAGNYSILASQILKSRSLKIFAFEPSKYSFDLLISNTKPFSNIRLFNLGFGKAEETVSLYSNYEGSGATSVYAEAFQYYNVNRNVVEKVKLETLDGFCLHNAIETIDLLKIDVEGHELPVLLGGAEMMKSRKIRFIQFEFGPPHIYSRTFFKDFWDLLSPLYKLYRIITDGIVEIKSYSENLEIFRTANFLAILK